MQLVITTAV